jgi:hypothetical protein
MKARVGYQELFQAIVDKCDELEIRVILAEFSEKTMMSMFTQHQNQV